MTKMLQALHGKYNKCDKNVIYVTIAYQFRRHQQQLYDLILYCYESDFMSNLKKSKRLDLIDRFHDTSWCLDDLFAVDNHEFVENISDIYPRKLQYDKANTSEKETHFLDLNKKVLW